MVSSYVPPASTTDIILLSACSFAGNVGAALTGFGQAIIFLLVWQIVELAGYPGDFKFAVFIQALSLFSMQPLLLYKAQVREHAYRRVLLLFVPITLISTPLGQLTADKVPTRTVQSVAGILVTFVACRELYSKRKWFKSWFKCGDKQPKRRDSNLVTENDNEPELKNDPDVKDDHVEEVAGVIENGEENEEPVEGDQYNGNETTDPKSPSSTVNNEAALSASSQSDGNKNEQPPLKFGLNKATLYTLAAGGASGFLGGMVAIRGPPLIFYFLHPPKPITFTKKSQRATGVVIMFFNVGMRIIFMLVNTFTDSDRLHFEKEDWRLYLSVIVCSIAGGFVGDWMFRYLKDSKDTIRGILAIFLCLCGISLLISAFAK